MKLWLISQDVNTFDSAVVSAATEEEAREIKPYESTYYGEDTWCEAKDVKVQYLGEAKEGTQKGVICASFNAG
jgi:hypothetical protein